MQMIISPAKKMRVEEGLDALRMPKYLEKTKELLQLLQGKSPKELQRIWKCNDRIAELNLQRIKRMNLEGDLTPAILAYEGIQFQYMSPGVFTQQELDYLDQHLWILSGFYGILRPFDGVTPYRLEMQAKLAGGTIDSLYDFWQDDLVKGMELEQNEILVDLASKEYSKAIYPYLPKSVTVVRCIFACVVGDKIVEKGTEVKMARGAMVRYITENRLFNIEGLKDFDCLGYYFSPEHTKYNQLVFLKGDQLC